MRIATLSYLGMGLSLASSSSRPSFGAFGLVESRYLYGYCLPYNSKFKRRNNTVSFARCTMILHSTYNMLSLVQQLQGQHPLVMSVLLSFLPSQLESSPPPSLLAAIVNIRVAANNKGRATTPCTDVTLHVREPIIVQGFEFDSSRPFSFFFPRPIHLKENYHRHGRPIRLGDGS